MDSNLAIWVSGSLILFIIGLYGISTKRDLFKVLISIELLLTSANFMLIGTSFLIYPSEGKADPLIQNFAILSQAVGGALIGLALIYLLAIYKHKKTLSAKSIRKLRW